jgi:hypothetical protein
LTPIYSYIYRCQKLLMKTFLTSLFSFLFIGVNAQPLISSFAPVKGPTGTSVTIRGSNFSTSPAGNTVYFGPVKANVVSSTDTSIIVTVPEQATYSPITVTVNFLTAYSQLAFNPTFPGGGGIFTSTSFKPKTDYTSGNYPHSVRFADFNNDGKSDMLVVKGSSSTLSVFPNTSVPGSLSFGAKTEIPASGNNHEDAVIADFDGDGKLDFASTSTFGSSSISIYRNTSTGNTISFATRVDYPIGSGPYTIATGDIDNNGTPDLVVANNGLNFITLFQNRSTPDSIDFSLRSDITVGTNPYGVAIGDLDGDNKAEIAVSTQGSTNALYILKNNGTAGTMAFAAPVNYAFVPGSFNIVIGDLDEDSKPEVVVASTATVIIIRNTSSPGNLSFSSAQSVSAGSYPQGVVISDLNGDGKPELATVNRSGNDVSVLWNTTTPGILSFNAPVNYPVGVTPITLVAADIDGDGRQDIAVANSSENIVSILKNIHGAEIAPTITGFTPGAGINGTSVTITGTNFTGATAVSFGGTAASSFTVDSATGITAVVGPGASGSVAVTTPYGTATAPGFIFNGPVINSFTPGTGVTGTVVMISGVNFTGATEVRFGNIPAGSFTVNSSTSITAVVGAGATGSVSVTTPYGIATKPGFSFAVPSITSFNPVAAVKGAQVTIQGLNFNPVAANNVVYFGAARTSVINASPTQLVVNVPAGATHAPLTVTTNAQTAYSRRIFMPTFAGGDTIRPNSFTQAANLSTGPYPNRLIILDLNNDGKTDVITVNASGFNLSLFKNTSVPGNVSFAPRTDLNQSVGPGPIEDGDFDGDGKKDLVVINSNSGNASNLSLLRNISNANISFAPKIDIATGNGTQGLAVSDMNADGKPDIVTTSGNSGFFSVFLNNSASAGSISFSPRMDFTLFGHPEVVVADLNMDGKPEIITSNFGFGTISVFVNTSAGTAFSLGAKIDYTAGSMPLTIKAGDIDGDGLDDIIVRNYNSNDISIFRNRSSGSMIQLASQIVINQLGSDLSLADLNGDGKLDLFTGSRNNGKMYLLQNRSTTGNFSFYPAVEYTPGNFDIFTGAGDIDGDGKPDLAVVTTTLNSLQVYRNGINDPLTAITALPSGTEVRIWPNPVQNKVFIDWTGTRFSHMDVEIRDLLGRKLLEKRLTKNGSLDLQALPAGYYFITIFQDRIINYKSMKLVKVN